jgi:serine/threonine protein kinase
MAELRRAHAPAASRLPVGPDGITAAPESWGGYHILDEIHRGGQGVVYRAIQRATKRTVALKVLLRGAFSTHRQRRRFEREIDLVAGLRHPNIVTVYDSGETPDGLHYFAMEYIEGTSLDTYVRAVKETESKPQAFAKLLGLFLTIAKAVSYAHQHGIIHRDLKPANIRVDEDGEPHILDFGLAKVVDQVAGGESTRVTRSGEFMGTLAYASPEQTRGDLEQVDVRSDVYALGVILYEILTGRFPYSVDGPVLEVLKAIAEADPIPPGTWYRRLGGDGDASTALKVNDEVATIVLKAMAKDKERRYQSAEALARDIGHFLAREPIDAKRDSRWYMLRKTIRRNKTPALAAVLIVVLTAGFAIVAALQSRTIAAERDATRAEALKAERTNAFLLKVLSRANPDVVTKGNEITFKEVLKLSEKWIEADLEEVPEVEADVRAIFGNTFKNLGDYDSATAHLRRSLKLRREHLGDQAPDTIAAKINLGAILSRTGHPAEAEQLYSEALEASRTTLGEQHDVTVKVTINLAVLLQAQGRLAEAEPLARAALAGAKAVYGDNHRDTLAATVLVAAMCQLQGKYDDAAQFYRELIPLMREHLGPDHPRTLTTMSNCGVLCVAQNKLDEAERLFGDVLAARRRVLGENHQDTLGMASRLAKVLQQRGKLAEAADLLRENIERQTDGLGENHPDVLTSRLTLANVEREAGDLEAAGRQYRELREIIEEKFDRQHQLHLELMVNLAIFLRTQGDLDEAEAIMRQVCETYTTARGAKHPNTLYARCEYAAILVAQGKLDEAEPICRETLTGQREVLGDDHPQTRASIDKLAELLQRRTDR